MHILVLIMDRQFQSMSPSVCSAHLCRYDVFCFFLMITCVKKSLDTSKVCNPRQRKHSENYFQRLSSRGSLGGLAFFLITFFKSGVCFCLKSLNLRPCLCRSQWAKPSWRRVTPLQLVEGLYLQLHVKQRNSSFTAVNNIATLPLNTSVCAKHSCLCLWPSCKDCLQSINGLSLFSLLTFS